MREEAGGERRRRDHVLISLSWPTSSGHEGRLHLADGIIHRGAPAFVEDFNAEDLGGRHCAVFVCAGDADVEGQDLIGIPGISQLFAAPTSLTLRLSIWSIAPQWTDRWCGPGSR
jgi:hypothetical protein